MRDGKGYTTDSHELVKKEITLHMRPFVDVMMREHQDTRDEVKDLKDLVLRTKFTTNDAIQYGLIGILFFLLLLLPTCS